KGDGLTLTSADSSIHCQARVLNGNLRLEVRTSDRRWQNHLLAYALVTEFGDLVRTSFLGLQEQPAGDLVGYDVVPGVEIDHLAGCELRLAPLAASQLVEADLPALRDASLAAPNNLVRLASSLLDWTEEVAREAATPEVLQPWFPRLLETLVEVPNRILGRKA